MRPSVNQKDLPDSDSPVLHLSHPTQDEYVRIWTDSSASWRDSLHPATYLQEQLYLQTVPLAKDCGMTTWILVDKNLPPDDRPILCSCESFLKRALKSGTDGRIEEVVVHGIASVSCPPSYRRRRYAARHMTEVAEALRTWQSDRAKVAGSVLYSDIGKSFYAKFGWQPNHTNWHLEFPPAKPPSSLLTKEIVEDDLADLCKRDEAMIRVAMAHLGDGVTRYVTILPDLDHMLWHMGKEDFATERLFGRTPRAKGAIAGLPGNQVWAIWTRRYYEQPDAESPNNVLYILRLVVEGDDSANKPSCMLKEPSSITKQEKQASSLINVLQHAQAEAARWRLDCLKLWEPSPWVQHVITESSLNHLVVQREEESIASGMWYNENDGLGTPLVWINNEHYAWC